MVEQNQIQEFKLAKWMPLLPLLSLVTVLLMGFLLQMEGDPLMFVAVITIMVSGGIAFYTHRYRDKLQKISHSNKMIAVAYLGTILLAMASYHWDLYQIWIVGGLTIAMVVDRKLGLAIHFNGALTVAIIMDLPLQVILYLVVIGTLMIFLANELKVKDKMIYGGIIVLSSNMTLLFLLNYFLVSSFGVFNYIASFFSVLLVISIAIGFHCIYERQWGNKEEVAMTSDEFSDLPEKKNIEIEDDIITGSGTSLSLLCEEENELLLQMKEVSETLYYHSKQIGELSSQAALLIDADEMVAKAGGFYHEVGKIKDRVNYIEEGIQIAKHYGFPKEVRNIIEEHNVNYETPTSVEAAIVLLADNIISTIDYIAQKGDQKLSTKKVIDQIFQLRMEKGTFDNTNLSLREYNQLKEFFQKKFEKNQSEQ